MDPVTLGIVGGTALAGAGSSIFNAHSQASSARKLTKLNYEYGQKSLIASPTHYKQGLEMAGINPILASNSPIGATQGSTGINPGLDVAGDISKGVSAKMLYDQTQSNIDLQGKQGNAAIKQAGASETSAKASADQAKASLINAETNQKKVDAEIKGIDSTISLNEAKKATEITLQGKHMSEEQKNRVASLAQWVTSEMSRAELDYWKRHPEQFDDYMEQKLKSEGNMNSARDWKKWTDAANTLLNVVDKAQDFIPARRASLSVKRSPTKYAPGF